jgi:ribulose-phosphate 3-epimerase
MIEAPQRFIADFAKAGADILTVQYEACTHLHRTIQQIHNQNMKAGVALNPHTPVMLVEDILEIADMILVMSVNPGFGGQNFIPNSLKKIELLKDLIKAKDTPTLIEVDGGVTLENAPALLRAGADVLVAGSAVFKSENPLQTIASLKTIKA